jgi:hypothetical protein
VEQQEVAAVADGEKDMWRMGRRICGSDCSGGGSSSCRKRKSLQMTSGTKSDRNLNWPTLLKGKKFLPQAFDLFVLRFLCQ